MKRLVFLFISIVCWCGVYAQSRNVKCTYAASHVISDAVKNMEDVHIRELVIEKFKNDKKTFSMIFANGIYSFCEVKGNEDPNFMVMGGSNSVYIDTNKDSIIAQKCIIDKDFLVKDKYQPRDWELTKERKTINGKECVKAITKGKSTITAWFTTEIPLSVGPLGYIGLPGIIMQLDTPTYSYVVQEIVELAEVPKIEKPTEGKVVTLAEFDKLEAEKMKSRGVEPGQVKIIHL